MTIPAFCYRLFGWHNRSTTVGVVIEGQPASAASVGPSSTTIQGAPASASGDGLAP